MDVKLKRKAATVFQEIRTSPQNHSLVRLLTRTHKLAKGWTAFIYSEFGLSPFSFSLTDLFTSRLALSGSIEVEGKKFEKYYTLLLSSEGDSTGVSVTALEDNSRFVLVSSKSLAAFIHSLTETNFSRLPASPYANQSSKWDLSS